MQIQTILNRIQKQRGFVYGEVRLEEQADGVALTIAVVPHARNRPACAGCRQRGPTYDRLSRRRFEFVPLWGPRVFFLYTMRRVDCPWCGVTVEQVPWADGKHQLTTPYLWFLATWAKRLSWQDVARVFRTSWDQVFGAVARAVAWGRDHVNLAGIAAIGIDEIQWQRGHPHAPATSPALAQRVPGPRCDFGRLRGRLEQQAKLTTRKAYRFRSYRCIEIALYHTLGQLPEPEATHRFC